MFCCSSKVVFTCFFFHYSLLHTTLELNHYIFINLVFYKNVSLFIKYVPFRRYISNGLNLSVCTSVGKHGHLLLFTVSLREKYQSPQLSKIHFETTLNCPSHYRSVLILHFSYCIQGYKTITKRSPCNRSLWKNLL